MIKILILFLFSLSAFASDLSLFKQPTDDEICRYTPPNDQINQLAMAALKYGNSQCHEESQDSYIVKHLSCLKGYGIGIKNTAAGFSDMVKFVLVDNPVYGVYQNAFHEIKKVVKGEYSISDMANQTANINIRSQAEIWSMSQKYMDQMKAYAIDMKNELKTQIADFDCMPEAKKMEIICSGISTVFLATVSPSKFVKGARWGQEHLRAMREFIVDTKNIHGLKDMSVAERLTLANQALKESRGITEILKMRNGRLVEEVLPDGHKIYKYEHQVKSADGKLHLVRREVGVDSNTAAMNGKEGIGKEVLAELIKAKKGSGSAIFIDVNHLGKANYFDGSAAIRGGTQGGDEYLASVADEIRRNLRPGDMLFKNGGDEFVVVFGANNPKIVKDVSQRIINSVDQNPRIKQFFKLQVKDLAQKYRDINKAKKFSDVPESVVKNLTGDEIQLAKKNFPKFAETKKAELKTALQEQARYRGSVSIGASLIKHEDTVESALERAENQAKKVKASYKTKYGHDVSKYKAEGYENTGSRRYGPAEAIDPD